MSQDVNVCEKKKGPFSVLWGGVKNYFTSFSKIGKNPVQLIPAIVLAVLWFLATLLPACGVNPGVIKVLGFLSFAQAGMSSNIVKIIGGVIGKGMYATAIYSLINLIKRDKSEKKPFFKSIAQSFSFNLKGLWVYILGAGIALFAFLFMAGNVSKWTVMGGLAATFLSAKNAVSGGFLYSFFGAVFEKTDKICAELKAKNFMSGMAAGFALAALIGLFNSNLVIIIIAGVLVIGGTVMIILDKCGVVKLGKKEGANV